MLKNQSTFVYIGNIHSNEISLNVKVTGITWNMKIWSHPLKENENVQDLTLNTDDTNRVVMEKRLKAKKWEMITLRKQKTFMWSCYVLQQKLKNPFFFLKLLIWVDLRTTPFPYLEFEWTVISTVKGLWCM